MASVTGMTKEAIDALMGEQVVSFRIDANGQLIYKTRAGVETNAGPIVAPTVALQKAYPVGSIFIATVSTNPNTLIGIGSWTRFARGRVLVGLNESETEFDGVEETGGSKTVTLSANEIPNHMHSIAAHTHSVQLTYNMSGVASGSSDRLSSMTFGTSGEVDRLGSTGSGGPTETGYTGGGQPHNNLQPYVVVYMWKRTS